jgi:hypothetical protein
MTEKKEEKKEKKSMSDEAARRKRKTLKKQGKSGIVIKPQNEGKFTAWAKAHGFSSAQAAASHVLAHKEKYSAAVIKMANFAHNSKKFK